MMQNRVFIFLLVFLQLGIIVGLKAQEITVNRSSVVENYKGKPFYIHFVSSGETLTAIAKAYNVSVEEIAAENPTVNKGLKADMVLRIPQKAGAETMEVKVKKEIKVNDPVKSTGDPEFTLYTVKKQETLYAISKRYGVTVEDILNSNPGLGVLKEGIEIKIPKSKPEVKPVISEPLPDKTVKPEEIPDEITVKTGETLYSLSKIYNTTVDELIELNPQLSGGLKSGMVLKLHKTIEKNSTNPSMSGGTGNIPRVLSDTNCYNPDHLKKTYNIALLLPFALDEASLALEAPVENDPSTYESFNYFQFYAGFMLAADSLVKYGLNAKIQVLDADRLNDTLTIRQTMRKPGMDKMDLLVGPMYASSFTVASRFAKKHEIGIVNPLSRRENIADGNPYVIKAQVSSEGISAKLSSFISRNYPSANIIAVQNDKKELKLLADDFITRIKSGIADHTFSGTLQESVFPTDQMTGLTKKLKAGTKNIVILFSNNKSAVPNFVSLLNSSAKAQEVILIGMDGWDELDLETEFLVNLNYHQLTTNYVDYESADVQQFVTRFRNKYGAVPLASGHAFLGYDIGWYFLTSLMWYGDNYLSCLPGNSGNGLQYNFSFIPAKPGDGLQNQDIEILKLQNYKMVPVE